MITKQTLFNELQALGIEYDPNATGHAADMDALSKSERKRVTALMERDLLRQFYADVCAEAETIMAQTGTVSGAHWNAMKRVLKRRGVEVAG